MPQWLSPRTKKTKNKHQNPNKTCPTIKRSAVAGIICCHTAPLLLMPAAPQGSMQPQASCAGSEQSNKQTKQRKHKQQTKTHTHKKATTSFLSCAPYVEAESLFVGQQKSGGYAGVWCARGWRGLASHECARKTTLPFLLPTASNNTSM